jgi:predicted ATPase
MIGFAVNRSGARCRASPPDVASETLDWSYELLSPPEQHALACLAVFPDTFDLEAAEAVTTGVPGDAAFDDAVDLLCRLVDKSLVVVHSEGTMPR